MVHTHTRAHTLTLAFTYTFSELDLSSGLYASFSTFGCFRQLQKSQFYVSF
jgi:hypothetical protein